MAALSIVIVAYQSGEFLRRALIAAADCAPEIVVVDNGSPEGETERICAAFANVRRRTPGGEPSLIGPSAYLMKSPPEQYRIPWRGR